MGQAEFVAMMETPPRENNPKIYCIGDSHVSFFSGIDEMQPTWPKVSKNHIPMFDVYRLGPALAFNLPRAGTQSQGREKLFEILSSKVPPRSHVLLSFGEIDCRAHLVKQAEKSGRSIEEVVDACLDEYFKAIQQIHELGHRIIIYNAVPSFPRTAWRQRAKQDAYAAYGSRKQRDLAIALFNRRAAERCATMGIQFLATAHHFARSNGDSIRWYFSDSIHLSQRAMPATLFELSKLFPEWGIQVPAWKYPNAWVLLQDYVSHRMNRLKKEITKTREKLLGK